jgi:acetyl/propionyl-CoA carboxylase alpha subunit
VVFGRGVRVDSHVYAGYTIPSHYDSMIGKLITYGKDRREAMDKMSRALGEYMITGVKTTIPFEQAILQDPDFRRGHYSTNFVERLLTGARRELIQVHRVVMTLVFDQLPVPRSELSEVGARDGPQNESVRARMRVGR